MTAAFPATPRRPWLSAAVPAAALAILAMTALSGPVHALGTESPPTPTTDGDDDTTSDDERRILEKWSTESGDELDATAFQGYRRAEILIGLGEYAAAIDALRALGRPDDANVLNLLGYSHRKLGLIDVGIAYYTKALKRNPAHRGVHEYLGEAYLQKNELGKAHLLLEKLEALCGGTQCEEYRALSEAIAAHETAGRI
ncbi:tetratricopeptide repeat protein [Kaustia mangrovi]|uniref:Tetratricopeptide repeat protein n=1 Tax=Kaustia mangrovi TaxID=2593653 RepID=A0A7S8C0W7_9HYPH|nr:tetratricopeptide repeat protein [Kaustia mangrovi]QPC41301.1 tetratricopeptide repeat protein [Kaustia mangrovi]